jgi:hypothetical protein
MRVLSRMNISNTPDPNGPAAGKEESESVSMDKGQATIQKFLEDQEY